MKKTTLKLVVVMGLLLCLGVSSQAASIVIRTSLQDSIPKYMQTADKEFKGICLDIMRAIEEVDPSIRFEYEKSLVPFARISRDLEVGSIDVFFGMVWNEEREELFSFIQPALYPTYNLLVVRADDPITTLASIDEVRALGRNGVILVDRATAHQAFLEEIGGLTIDSGGGNRRENLAKLMGQRGRFYYSTDIGLIGTIEEMELQDKVRFLPLVLVEDFQYAAFSQHASAETKERVSNALAVLQENGTLALIRARYIP